MILKAYVRQRTPSIRQSDSLQNRKRFFANSTSDDKGLISKIYKELKNKLDITKTIQLKWGYRSKQRILNLSKKAMQGVGGGIKSNSEVTPNGILIFTVFIDQCFLQTIPDKFPPTGDGNTETHC